MISYDIYLFHYYSLDNLLDRLIHLGVEIKTYKDNLNGTYYLKIKRKYRKIIKCNFKDYVIVEKLGFVNTVEKIILAPTLVISFVLSISLFAYLSGRIYDVRIKGDYPFIEDKIREYLRNNGVDKYRENISLSLVKELEIKASEEFKEDIEFVEITKNGATIDVYYKKRRKKADVKEDKGSLYATKDGVIRGFSLEKGVKRVKVYDFVKKGDLLVDEMITTSKEENVKVGSRGKVFASTFYYIEVSADFKEDEAYMYSYLLSNARKIVSENINSSDEYIEKESVLKWDYSNKYMRVYYVLYEDITI